MDRLDWSSLSDAFSSILCTRLEEIRYFSLSSIFYYHCSISYFFVTESARWFRSVQRYDDSKKVLRKIARYNKKHFDENLEITESKKSMRRTTPLDLFKTNKLAVYTLSQGFVWLVNSMVYYGISLAADELGGSLYLNWVYISLVEIPSAILGVICTNRFGRKPTTTLSMIIAGAFCIVVPFMPPSDNGNPTRLTGCSWKDVCNPQL